MSEPRAARRLSSGHLPAGAVDALAAGLGDRFGRSIRIAALHMSPMDGFSTNPIFRLRLSLASGERLVVVAKQFARKPEKDACQEIRLYERVLAGGRFNAPDLYAAICDEENGCHWLFLEDVGDWRLDYCGDDDWLAAFRWLARLHAAFYDRPDELAALGCLHRHDPAFYGGLARLARQQLADAGRARALARFDRMLDRWFKPTVAHLVSQPVALVHGDLSCHNLMVQSERGIRPIDWEWSAIGVPGWDLAKLLSGWGTQKRRLLAAYLKVFAAEAGSFDRAAFAATLDLCEVMEGIWYLRWWTAGRGDPGSLVRLLDKLEHDWRATWRPRRGAGGTT